MMPLVGHQPVTLSTNERISSHSNNRSRLDEKQFETSNLLDGLKWEFIESPLVDQGPLFLSCAALNSVSRQLIFVSSMPKNRFCELVRFDMGSRRWLTTTRTRHFRPPKRIGSAAAIARGHVFIFGGYELSNQICQSGETVSSPSEFKLTSSKIEPNGCPGPLFAYPSWWINGQGDPGDLYNSSRGLVEALGDFHGYDLNRGEWKVLVSRDQRSYYTAFSDGLVDQSHRLKAPFRSPVWKTVGCDYAGNSGEYGEKNVGVPFAKFGDDDIEVSVPCPRAFHTLVRHGCALLLFGGERRVRLRSGKSYMEHLNDLWMFHLRELRWSLLLKGDSHPEKCSVGAEGGCSAGTTRSEDLRYLTVSTATSVESCFGTDKCGDEVVKREVPLETEECTNESAPRPAPRSGHSAVFYMDSLYIYGGQNSGRHEQFNDLWSFNTNSCRWRHEQTKGPSPGARCGHVAVVIGNGMCIYGGLTSENIAERASSNGLHRGLQSSGTTKFSDANAIYYLNFESFTWSIIRIDGAAPEESRFFGRQYCFFWAKALWLGGSTGRRTFTSEHSGCSANLHELARLELPGWLNGSRKYQRGWDTSMGNDLVPASLPFATLHDYRSNDSWWTGRGSLKNTNDQDSSRETVTLNASTTTSSITTITTTTSSSAAPSRHSNFMNFLQDTPANAGKPVFPDKSQTEEYTKPEPPNLCCDLEADVDWRCNAALQRVGSRGGLYSDCEFIPLEGYCRASGTSTANKTDCHTQFLALSPHNGSEKLARLDTLPKLENPGLYQRHQSFDLGNSNFLEGDFMSNSDRPWGVSDNTTMIGGKWSYLPQGSSLPQLRLMTDNVSPRPNGPSCSDHYYPLGLPRQPWAPLMRPETQSTGAAELRGTSSSRLLPVGNQLKLNGSIPCFLNSDLTKAKEHAPGCDDLPPVLATMDKPLETSSLIDCLSLRPEDLLLLNLDENSEGNSSFRLGLEQRLPHAEAKERKTVGANSLELSEFDAKNSTIGFSGFPTDCKSADSKSARCSEGNSGDCREQTKCSVTLDGDTIQKIKQQVSSLHAEVVRHREENSKLKSAIMLLIPHLKMEESGAVTGSQCPES